MSHRRVRTAPRLLMCPRLTFSRLISNIFPSSITQVDSSSLTSCGKSPARIGGWPFSPQLRCFFAIDTITSLGLTEKFTFIGTLICKKRTLWIYMFLRTRSFTCGGYETRMKRNLYLSRRNLYIRRIIKTKKESVLLNTRTINVFSFLLYKYATLCIRVCRKNEKGKLNYRHIK